MAQRMHDAQRGVAGGDVVDQHAQRAHVVELGELQALALHLAPDRIDVFRTPGNVGREAGFPQRIAELLLRRRDPGFASAATLVEQTRDASVHLRLQVAEREILEFPLDLPDTEPVRQRRMDVRTELRQRALLGLRRALGRAHAHELAREQDEDHRAGRG